MRRTRKWAYVAQEAQRLADLRLSPRDIAARLEVQKSTVTRWIASGKLTQKAGGPKVAAVVMSANVDKTAAQWAASVRAAYDLDSTDEQLVTLAESTLLVARDPDTPAVLRLQAMGRYQAIVKQLSLVARAADAKQDEAPKRRIQTSIRTGTDPRGILTDVTKP